jgi:hypothetical protein
MIPQNFQPALAHEHYQQLQHEAHMERISRTVPSRLWSRGLALLGDFFITVGRRLKQEAMKQAIFSHLKAKTKNG